MSNLQQAASNVQHLAKQYAAVIELGKLLEGLGVLENLEAEARDRVTKLREEETNALRAKSAAEVATQKVLNEQVEVADLMRVEKDRLAHEAHVYAQGILAAAEAQAKLVLSNANAAASAVADAKDELEQEFHELEGAIAERRAELTALNDSIKALKEKFA